MITYVASVEAGSLMAPIGLRLAAPYEAANVALLNGLQVPLTPFSKEATYGVLAVAVVAVAVVPPMRPS